MKPGTALPKYQYGTGCLADQLLGQYLAHVTGLGYVLDSSHVKRAMHSIFRTTSSHRWDRGPTFSAHTQLNDEAGLVLCTWPRGDRPSLPFPYCDEVWTGFEYQVAASLIYNDLVDEGLKVVKAARDRYNGLHRNPWDEEECGHHYARAMSSWALLLALSGFHYDGVTGVMAFAPAEKKGRFSSFWSCGTGWGTMMLDQTRGKRTISLRTLHGRLSLNSLALPGISGRSKRLTAMIDGKPVKAQAGAGKHVTIRFNDPVGLTEGNELRVTF